MNGKAYRLLLIALVLSSAITSAQSKRETRDMFHEAGSWMLYEEYQDALPLYLKLLELNPGNYNARYHIGICYLNIPGQKQRALTYLQEASENINPGYKEGKFRETGAPHDALFYLATAYRIDNQLDKAIETYHSFYTDMDHGKYDSAVVKLQIRACHNAKDMMDVPLYLRLNNLGETINESRSEVNPVVSADEKTIVFTRELPFYEGLFYSKKVDGIWSAPIQMQEELLIDDGYPTSLSPDGKELYIYRNDGYDGNIYFSEYINGRWSPAEILNDNINTKYWESHACISGDDRKLYFTSNRKGGYGGLDIYLSEKDSLDDWGPARNLGPAINTPFNEESPFLDKDGKILFFSSRGHFNMGGHDIFHSAKTVDNRWAAPVNMGYPVNTTDDDLFFSTTGQNNIAYLSRFSAEGYGMKDIFRAEIFSEDNPRKFMARGIVRLKDLLPGYRDSVKISTLDKPKMDTLLVVYSDPLSGEYDFVINNGEYKLIYESEGSKTIEKNLNISISHPEDSIGLAHENMLKADNIATLTIALNKDTVHYREGDTVEVNLMIEPRSILIAEHWCNDSLIKKEAYFINDPVFSYQTEAFRGDNNISFTLKDRFNNTSSENYNFHTSIYPEEKKLATETLQDPPAEDDTYRQQLITDSLETINARETESIRHIDKVISSMNEDGNSTLMKDAIRKTNEKQINKAGLWLQTLYSIAVEDGAEKEMLAQLIAAISADVDESAESYIKRVSQFAAPALKAALADINPGIMDSNNIEEIIMHLLNNAGYGYSEEEIFEAFAEMISSTKKSGEEIIDYISPEEGSGLWALWILLSGIAIAVIFFGVRRKKEKND